MIDKLRKKIAIRLAAYQRMVSSYYNERVYHRALEEGDLVLKKFSITTNLKKEGKLRDNFEGAHKIQKILGANTCAIVIARRDTWKDLEHYTLEEVLPSSHRDWNSLEFLIMLLPP